MKKLMFALACAASAAVMGTDTLNNKATFEAFDVGTKAAALVNTDDSNSNAENSSKFWALALASDTAADASEVTAYETAPAVDNSQYLRLETNGDELRRKVKSDGAEHEVGDGLYIDTLVQFTATPDATSLKVDGDAKLAIWLEGEEDDGYKLKCRGKAYANSVWTDHDFELSFADITVEPNKWYRLVVHASANAIPAWSEAIGDATQINGFKIRLDDVIATVEGAFDADTLSYLEDEDDTYAYNQWIPSIVNTGTFKLASVGFQGSGAIDTVTITDEDLYPDVVPSVEFTLTITFGDGVSAVTYTVGDATAVPVTKSGTEVSGIAKDETVSITVTEVADWFVAPAVTTFEMTENTNVTVTATAVAVDENGALPAGTTAADLGIKTGAFASADTAALAPLVAWAQDKEVSIANINKMTFDANGNPSGEGDALTLAEAFLLNCASGEVNAEKEEFKLTITFDENGAPVVSGPEGKTYNGQIKVKGKASLSDADWADKVDGHKFFKAFLTK